MEKCSDNKLNILMNTYNSSLLNRLKAIEYKKEIRKLFINIDL